MTETLEFPDGVRLAELWEIPGPEPARSAAWERIKRAKILPGYTLVDSTPDAQFRHYAEVNVNASLLWATFHDLCMELFTDSVMLIAGDIDDKPRSIVGADVPKILASLSHFQYQLAHDGFLQFGLLNDSFQEITEVLVKPTKHFQVWLNDVERFRFVMKKHGLSKQTEMEFIDQYPRTTTRLPDERGALADRELLWNEICDLVGGRTRVQ